MATTSWTQQAGMDGTPSGENITEYVDRAETAATTAETAATNAAASQTSATTAASAASTSASAASTSATAASTSASAASTSATAASTSATAAASSATSAATAQTAAETAQTGAETAETNAETAQAAAETAQTAAEAAQAAAEAAQASIDEFYLGAQASNPTVDGNGDPVTTGDWYFNSTDNETRVYNGSTWQVTAVSSDGFLTTANNLSDLDSAATARTNLGLGTAATTASTDYATAAQGTLADSALQSGDNISTLTNDSGYITTYTVTESDVTTHQAALSITESQISDFGTYLTSYTETDPVVGAISGIVKADGAGNISAAVAGTDYLASYTELNDLTASVTWANVPDANITQSSVTQHQAALSVTESQISDLGSYASTGKAIAMAIVFGG